MSLSRTCDACDEPIRQSYYLELGVRVMKTDESENQDQKQQFYGDYCDACIADGKALANLCSELRYKNGKVTPEKK